MLAPRSKHQQRLGFQMHGIGQEQGAQLFTQRCAAGFAALHKGNAARVEPAGDPGQLRAFARAIDAFNGNETSAHLKL